MKKVILVAGGTGGHFFAAMAVGEELETRGYEVHIITDLRCQKYIPTSHSKLTFHIIDLKRYSKSSLQKIKFFIVLSVSVIKSVKLLYNLKPNIVVGFGGYPVVSSLFAARWLRIPIIIYEQNSYLGRVNKFFTKFATKIALAAQETKNLLDIPKNKTVITGGVVRADIREILLVNKELEMSPRGLTTGSQNSLIKTSFNNNIFRIFIFGGSQGAKIFSELLPKTIKLLIQKHPQLRVHITQQVSDNDQMEIKKIYSQLNISYQLAEFFTDIADQYQNTDLVISRAGASTIEELTYIGLPAIFIPLPTATDNHQYFNAKLLENAGAGWCMEQSNISEEKLADKILSLIKNPNMLEQATKNLLKRKKEGHKLLSDLVEEVVK